MCDSKSDRRFPFCSAKWEHGHGDRICYCRCLRRRMRHARSDGTSDFTFLNPLPNQRLLGAGLDGHREVLIKAYVHELVICCASEVIAGHPRNHEREDMIFDPLHYLALIEQKPNALDQAAPFAHFRRRLHGRPEVRGARGGITYRMFGHGDHASCFKTSLHDGHGKMVVFSSSRSPYVVTQ